MGGEKKFPRKTMNCYVLDSVQEFPQAQGIKSLGHHLIAKGVNLEPVIVFLVPSGHIQNLISELGVGITFNGYAIAFNVAENNHLEWITPIPEVVGILAGVDLCESVFDGTRPEIVEVSVS